MQYNGSSTGQDIVTETNDLANTTDLIYPLTEKTRAANKMLALVWSWILDAYNGWESDDSASSDFPIATTTLTSGQADYDIPTGSQTIRSVSILAPSGTQNQEVFPITEEEFTSRGISEGAIFTTTGTPIYYRPIGTSIKLYPTPSYTMAQGLRVTFDRGLANFVPTDTTKEPGFASQFHNVLPVGMALDFAARNNLTSEQGLQRQLDDFERRMKLFYSKRYQEKYPNVIKNLDVTWDYL